MFKYPAFENKDPASPYNAAKKGDIWTIYLNETRTVLCWVTPTKYWPKGEKESFTAYDGAANEPGCVGQWMWPAILAIVLALAYAVLRAAKL